MSALFSLVPWYYRLLAISILIGATYLTGYIKGADAEADEQRVAQAVAANKAFDEYIGKNKQLNAIAQQLEDAKNGRKNFTETITKNVDRFIDRPIYRNVCLDTDGLLNANAALKGGAADAGKLDAAVPKPDGIKWWYRSGSAEKDR